MAKIKIESRKIKAAHELPLTSDNDLNNFGCTTSLIAVARPTAGTAISFGSITSKKQVENILQNIGAKKRVLY